MTSTIDFFGRRLAARRNLTVTAKFGLIVGLGAAVILAVSIAFISERVRTEDKAQSQLTARATAARIAADVRAVFENAFNIVSEASDSLVSLKDNGISDPAVYDAVLKHLLETNGDRYGAWLIWDGADAPVSIDAFKTRFDGTGRFATYWHQNGMEMLRDVVPPEITDSDLYLVPAKGEKSYLLEPHVIDAVDGDPTLVTSFATPLNHDGKAVGVLAVDLKLASISEALSSVSLPEGASITVVSDRGIIAMSTTNSLVGKHLKDASRDLLPFLALARKGDGSTQAIASGGATELTSWSAIHFAEVKNPWFLIMSVPRRSVLAATSSDRLFLLQTCFIALFAILFIVFLAINRLVSVPLQSLSIIINSLGGGLFDFAVPHCDKMDEVGDIARAVQRLQESGLEIARLHEKNGESEYLRQSARRVELDGISERFSRSIEKTAAKIHAVAKTVEMQSRTVSTNTKSVAGRLVNMSNASIISNASLNSVATSTSSLLGTIEAISEQTQKNKAAAEKVDRHTSSTDESINELNRKIGAIGTVATLITQVASQTNMIALNATIEAARAGEAGRSFAVVANEIKELAKQTTKAIGEIDAHLKAIENASVVADGNLAEMKKAAHDMHFVSTQIASSLDIQALATDKIRDMINGTMIAAANVTLDTVEAARSSNEIEGAADVMLKQSVGLESEISDLNSQVADFLHFLRAA